MKKTLIVISALNEATKIGGVIKDLKTHGWRQILVVDDGSNDETGAVAQKSGAKILTHVVNRGLGAGLGTGFEYARRNAIDYLVTFDGDGQHQAADIKRLVAPLVTGVADVVIGSRLLRPKKMPVDRFLLNLISNFATLLLYRVWTTDTLSGLRAFNRQSIEKIQIKTDRMAVSNEFFMEIRRNNLRLKEIPIKPIYTKYSKTHSHNATSIANYVLIARSMFLRLFR